tara:strand:+ start:387 stop:515 length:129 start_codon:yes stop_codon:yes gene_type:complete
MLIATQIPVPRKINKMLIKKNIRKISVIIFLIFLKLIDEKQQ